jgi:hypothetical protein
VYAEGCHVLRAVNTANPDQLRMTLDIASDEETDADFSVQTYNTGKFSLPAVQADTDESGAPFSAKLQQPKDLDPKPMHTVPPSKQAHVTRVYLSDSDDGNDAQADDVPRSPIPFSPVLETHDPPKPLLQLPQTRSQTQSKAQSKFDTQTQSNTQSKLVLPQSFGKDYIQLTKPPKPNRNLFFLNKNNVFSLNYKFLKK